jgi:hypothetical protein
MERSSPIFAFFLILLLQEMTGNGQCCLLLMLTSACCSVPGSGSAAGCHHVPLLGRATELLLGAGDFAITDYLLSF